MILAASGGIFCDNSLSPSDFSPNPNEGPLGEEEEPTNFLGYWRIWGIIDAPLDWEPDSSMVRIMMGEGEPEEELVINKTFTLVYIGLDYKRLSFKTYGNYYYGQDPDPYFIPLDIWWSDPGEEEYRQTWVWGYKWVEFGGGYQRVLADEDTSTNPFYPPWPQPEYKYYPIYPGDEYDYWAWDTVYLDVR